MNNRRSASVSMASGSMAVMLSLGSLGGCAVGPNFEKPEATAPKSWSATGDPRIKAEAATDSLWWKGFGDPVLDRLIELAYRQNLSLQITGLRIVEARAQYAVATGRMFPQTQVAFGSASAVGLSENVSKIGNLPRNYIGYQAGFDVAWEMDLWGKYRRGVEAQAASVIASLADYYSGVVSLTAEVARMYVGIVTFEILIEQARHNVGIQEQALEIAESRFRNGATSELDQTQAKTLLESTRATIPQLEISLQQARNALSTLLGQPTGAVDALLVGPKAIPKVPKAVAVDLPTEMLRRRPDIRSAEFVAAAQCARIGVAKAALYPSFSLLGTFGLDTSTRGTASANLFAPSSLFYVAGPQVNWSFFNYGRLENAVRVEDARFQQTLVSYRSTVLKAAQEVEDALTGFLKSQQTVQFEQGAVTAALRSVELAVARYREGEADYQRVLDTQRSLLERQYSLTQASSAVVTNMIALYKALGGGWELRLGDPVVPESMQRKMKERTNWGGGDMLSEPRSPEKKPPPAHH